MIIFKMEEEFLIGCNWREGGKERWDIGRKVSKWAGSCESSQELLFFGGMSDNVLRVSESRGGLEEQFCRRAFSPGKYSSWLDFWVQLGLEATTGCGFSLQDPSELRHVGMRR